MVVICTSSAVRTVSSEKEVPIITATRQSCGERPVGGGRGGEVVASMALVN